MEEFIYKKVKSINFGVFSPKQIYKMAAVKIVTPELYDKEGYPVDGGLMDVRLGVIDPGLRCKTCGQRLKECSGHFGYIELARPIIHFTYVKVILDLLRSICNQCGRVLIPEDKVSRYKNTIIKTGQEEGTAQQRAKIKEIIKKLKTRKKCPHCKAKLDKIVLEKPTTFYEGETKLSPIEIRARMEKIQDSDLILFGINPKFTRPEWMILTVLSIPPVTIRPSITLETGERSEDDLTHKLGDVVRINQRLFENINAGAPEVIIEDLWDLLQYHITTFFDNEVAQLPPARHRGGQPLKTVTARIKSKEGRIRHNLAGKRTNFSARTVISPDPMLELNEVGVPYEIARKLTVPETITGWNKEHFKKFVERGSKEYPGANYIVRPDGRKKRITEETKEEILEELSPGYQVERHLMDGDLAIFNRQPSLHRMSMMCHKVRVLPGRTFRLNPSVCAPYNADFDGDEMNLHIPQTEESRAEAELLMLVQTQLISPRYGLSIIGCKEDSTTGLYLLTKENQIEKEEALDLLYSTGLKNIKLPRTKKVSGAAVFSNLLPEDFNYVGANKKGDKVVVKNGQLTEGAIDVASLGEESGLLIRSFHEKYGDDATNILLSQLTKLGIKYLLSNGFSTGIKDTDLTKQAIKEIQKIIETAQTNVQNLIDQYEAGKLEALPGRSINETLELRILETLNKARNKAGEVLAGHSRQGGSLTMATCGAKGSILNLSQISAIVGQQALRGKRIEKGYRHRTISYFRPHDLRSESHGFISSSYKKGMNPAEFYFGAMTGRDSLMDTALRTPKSGYLYRRLANAMQDLKVEYDGTVRDVGNKIIQYEYGEDGIDVSKSENGIINIKRIIDEVTLK